MHEIVHDTGFENCAWTSLMIVEGPSQCHCRAWARPVSSSFFLQMAARLAEIESTMTIVIKASEKMFVEMLKKSSQTVTLITMIYQLQISACFISARTWRQICKIIPG